MKGREKGEREKLMMRDKVRGEADEGCRDEVVMIVREEEGGDRGGQGCEEWLDRWQ